MYLSSFPAANSLPPHHSHDVVQTLILEDRLLQAFAPPHLHDVVPPLRLTIDPKEILIHTDQDLFHARDRQDGIELVQDPFLPDLVLLQEDEAADEIARDGMVDVEEEVQATAAIAAMMIGVEAGVVGEEDEADVKGRGVC